ncbi:hypothetical protein CLV30_12236 [Haloactinopolyspora alba]|uniref:GH15 family glucan-1,4-alpha-glucosidase n=1 Tax=Haloactinopolyspora alba TaxID=648780 RepID=A0A2P8DK12_9ACTN|nr:hypothetical protein CLV30_12236 [Haloactinopolyspora alba]
MVVVIAVLGMAPTRGTILELRAGGVTTGPSGAVKTVPPTAPDRFVDGTSVLDSADRSDPSVAERIRSDRSWLRSGSVPGAGEFRGMAERALLDLRVLTSDTGALMAAPVTAWRHVWPRDASFAIAAYSVTGHHAEAADVFGFLSRVAPADGRWEARYRTDGSGPPDDRPQQLDGSGWVLWALWTFVHTAPDDELVDDVVSAMRPAAVASADAIVESLGDDGLPEASSDYWEKSEEKVTLGIAAPLSVGLRAAVDLAGVLDVDPARWRSASDRLDEAVDETFGAHGYPRTLPDGGDDAAVTFLAPPFAPVSDPVSAAVEDAERSLRVPNGGHRPGEVWTKDVGVAWTPETAMFALALAGQGDREGAERLLTFLDEHRTPQGSLPEKVDARADPASVAPLAWTSSLVLLTLTALDGELPVVPGPD